MMTFIFELLRIRNPPCHKSANSIWQLNYKRLNNFAEKQLPRMC